jgi:hypothetical protein
MKHVEFHVGMCARGVFCLVHPLQILIPMYEINFGFNKKIHTKLAFPPKQKNRHNRTTVLYTKYVHNTKNYFPPEPKKLTQHHNCMVL